MVYIRAQEGPPNCGEKASTVQYFDEHGKWYITGVHIKRGVIQEYCIHKNGSDAWISKEEAILLASERRIHAILVHSPNGSFYLRPEYKGKRFRDLIC